MTRRPKNSGMFLSEDHPRHGYKHGLSERPEYGIWKQMRARCHRPSDPYFKDYGARGIQVCEAWKISVETFIADMGPRPSPLHSLDRRDNDGHYEPDNCRWATKLEQSSNQRSNVMVDYGSDRITLSEACRRAGMKYNTVWRRLSAGWDIDKALATPPRPFRR